MFKIVRKKELNSAVTMMDIEAPATAEIVEKLKITDGGGLSRNLNALISSDFITKYVPFGHGKREEHYKLIDPFCIFYLHFVNGQKKISEKFWQQNVTSASVSSWRGYAFENVCFNHIEQIKRSL